MCVCVCVLLLSISLLLMLKTFSWKTDKTMEESFSEVPYPTIKIQTYIIRHPNETRSLWILTNIFIVISHFIFIYFYIYWCYCDLKVFNRQQTSVQQSEVGYLSQPFLMRKPVIMHNAVQHCMSSFPLLLFDFLCNINAL